MKLRPLTPTAARDDITRAVRTLGGDHQVIAEGTGLDRDAVTLTFRVGAISVRRSVSKPTVDESLTALAVWIRDRAWTITHHAEGWREAFADCATVADEASWDEPLPSRRAFTSDAGVPESIVVFRSALRRLKTPERNIKVTWDSEKNFARYRMQLASGDVVEKVVRSQGTCDANLALLSQWLRRRALGWVRGTESMDLDRVFAGNIVRRKP